MKQDPQLKFHNIFSAEDLIKSEGDDPWKPQDIINHANALGELQTLNVLNEIKNNTLIIAGEKDKLTPKSSSIQVHEKIPNSKLEIIPGGH